MSMSHSLVSCGDGAAATRRRDGERRRQSDDGKAQCRTRTQNNNDDDDDDDDESSEGAGCAIRRNRKIASSLHLRTLGPAFESSELLGACEMHFTSHLECTLPRLGHWGTDPRRRAGAWMEEDKDSRGAGVRAPIHKAVRTHSCKKANHTARRVFSNALDTLPPPASSSGLHDMKCYQYGTVQTRAILRKGRRVQHGLDPSPNDNRGLQRS